MTSKASNSLVNTVSRSEEKDWGVLYNIGEGITAFTTNRSVGRDRGLLGNHLAFTHFTYPHQTHTDRVMQVAEEFFSLSESTQKMLLEGVDAVISNVRQACIGISTADCIPVLVFDPEHHCAAAIHAGWRGTVARIVVKAVEEMQRAYATKPEDCLAVIGPGISQNSFEIGWEVHQQFVEAGFPMDEVTVTLPSNDGNGFKPHIDLKEINRQQLLSLGFAERNITVSPIDTFTDTRFFSARREQTGTEKCGRILSGFILQ